VSPIKTDTISLELNGDFFVSTILQEEPLIIYKKNDKGSYASLEIEKSKTFDPKNYKGKTTQEGEWTKLILPTWEKQATLQKISNEKFIYYKKIRETYVTITELDYTGGVYDKNLESIIQSIKTY